LADEDADLVGSVSGLRQILSNITADSSDDKNHMQDVQPADNEFSPPLSSKHSEPYNTGAASASLDNRSSDGQPADISTIVMNRENEMDEKSDEEQQTTSEMETECTGGVMFEEAKGEILDKELEGTLDKDVKSTDSDEVLLTLTEAKEYPETSDIECRQEPTETSEREAQAAENSIVTMSLENEMGEKLENSFETNTMHTDNSEVMGVTKDRKSDEELDGTLDEDMISANTGEVPLPSTEAKEYSDTDEKECDQESAEIWEKEMDDERSTDIGVTMAVAEDEKSEKELQGTLVNDIQPTDMDKVVLPLDEAQEYPETEDMECRQESAETRESEMKYSESEEVEAGVEKCPELLDIGVGETSEMGGKWSETDAARTMAGEREAAAADISSDDSPRRDDVNTSDGYDDAEYHSSSLAKICADYDDDDDEQVR